MAENTTNVEEVSEDMEVKEAAAEEAVQPVMESAPMQEEKKAGKKPFFRFREKDEAVFSRDEWILQNIKEEDMMEYLRLEYKRMEFQQNMKEIKSKRILRAFELTVCLAAIVAMTYFLKDNPTILISVLYTLGIISVFWIWKNPKDKKDNK